MRVVCLFTHQHPESVRSARRCIESGKRFGVKVEPYPAIFHRDMRSVHAEYGLHMKYRPVIGGKTDFAFGTMPRTRIANGTTHYLLYLWSAETGKPIHILEHDAYFVGEPPEPNDGVIQTSSHTTFQMTPETLRVCGRAKRQRTHEPGCNQEWESDHGVIRHPLSGTNGTSGYIIGPAAAERMVAYIQSDGIANADRLRKEHVGDIYLQVPQSVFCDHGVRSHRL